MTPRIAIPLPTSRDLAYNQRSWPAYASAVTRSGGEAVAFELGSTPAQLRALAATCDGVLLPGSPADVDPALYGAERDPASAPADPAREAMDYFLLDDAAKYRKPILGICYGVQLLNVWLGGSLVQDLTPLPVNHEAGSKVAIAHTALIAPGSLLGSLLGPEKAPESDGFLRLPVNTSHHQAIAAQGNNLRIVARCPDDGVIEAVELQEEQEIVHLSKEPEMFQGGQPPELFHVEHSRGLFHVEHSHRPQFLLGVQWHPERSYEISAASRALFHRLIAEARSFADSKEADELRHPATSAAAS
jgi:putative glutamine amidotransferase